MKENYIQIYNSGTVNVESRATDGDKYHYVVRVNGAVKVSFLSFKLSLVSILERAYLTDYYKSRAGSNYWKTAVPSAIAEALRSISYDKLVGEIYLDTFHRLVTKREGKLELSSVDEIGSLINKVTDTLSAKVVSFSLTTNKSYRTTQRLVAEFNYGPSRMQPIKTVILDYQVLDGDNPFNYSELANAMNKEINMTILAIENGTK